MRNLGGDRTAATELVAAFAQAFIRTVPTGKDRPTAPMTAPDLVHLALRSDRPVSLAAAFERPIRALDEGHVTQAADRLDTYAGRLHRLLGSDRQLCAGHAHVLDQTPANLGDTHDAFDDLVRAAVARAFDRES